MAILKQQNPKITRALAKLAALREKTKQLVESTQAACPHTIVMEKPYTMSGTYIISSDNACRICCNCGLKETGSVWSGGNTWSAEDHSPSKLGNSKERLVLSTNGVWEEFTKWMIHV